MIGGIDVVTRVIDCMGLGALNKKARRMDSAALYKAVLLLTTSLSKMFQISYPDLPSPHFAVHRQLSV
jgi:hypothetical protein